MMTPTLAGMAPIDAGARIEGRERLLGLALSLAAYVAAILIVFRHVILSDFDLGFGNRGDAIIEISVLEHWRAWLMGAATWNQLLYFHPNTDTLGYNDGYFLSGLIYSGWRTAFDPFTSDTLTAFTYKSIGYFGTLWLVRGVLGWRWSSAVLIALLATISNNMYLQSGHAQIQSLALLPLLASFAILAVRAEIAGKRVAWLHAALTAALLGAWLVTSFYFAWFAGYFCLALIGSWLWLTGRWRPSALKPLACAHWRTLSVFAGATAIAAIPFLLVYAPKVLETGGHGFMISYTAQPTDPFNVGENNLLWGWIGQGLRAIVEGVSAPGSGLRRAMLGVEHESGFPLLLFALICAAGWQLLRQRGDASFARAFALAILISWALTLRIWQVSPWILVHYLVPAASGLRVVLRYQLFLVLPVLLLVGIVHRVRFEQLWQRRPLLAGLLVAFLIAEQINFSRPLELSRANERAAFNAIPAPPAGCRAFYAVVTRPGEKPFIDARIHGLYAHNVDAMFLAERWRMPTINGFSTFNPPGWNFADPEASDYDARVADYARSHHVEGLCRLDMRDAQPWSSTPGT